MVDWWQPLLYIGAGGVVSLLTAYATNRLTRSTLRESERGEAERRKEEERRQSIKQILRERIEPIFAYLKLAKQYFAHERIELVVDRVYDRSAKDSMSAEEFRERVKTMYPAYAGQSDD